MFRKPDITWTDEALVKGCLEGRHSSWVALVEKYRGLIYNVTARYSLSTEDAAEVFQGVWTDLYRDLTKLGNSAALRSWLITSASRRSLRMKTQRNARMETELVDASGARTNEDPASIHEAAEQYRYLRDALQRLSPRCQDLLRMFFFSDPPETYSAAAKKLGLATGSIGFIRGCCLQKLRAILAKMGMGE